MTLIAFEGLPGAGKSTQSRLLAEHLDRAGHAVVYLPDNLTRDTDDLGATLLSLFTRGDPFARHDSVVTEVHLAAAIRTHTLATHIEPTLDQRRTVVEDRGLHTMYSYSLATLLQRHRSAPDLAIAWLYAVGALTGRAADRSLWLRLPVDEAIARAEHRQRHPYTAEQRLYLRYVDDAYRELADRDPTLIVVDVAGRTVNEVHAAVLAALAGDLAASRSNSRPLVPTQRGRRPPSGGRG
ncbi:dTMP kinase [Dactylosporangium darangshiense]|uniref:dTMP kinase n=1 Tax=Dactylosporangium darangshiense TaxID=579108 RepID=UPI003642E398